MGKHWAAGEKRQQRPSALRQPLPDWEQIYRILALGEAPHRLWEIEKLTEVEAAFLCDQDLERRRPPMGARALLAQEIAEYANRRRSLSWKDKLRAAVEEW